LAWLILLLAAALAGVAAAGVLWPFGRRVELEPEPEADPLEDERALLLRSLEDLEQERAGGGLEEEDYRALRRDTERRAVAVLRALEYRRDSWNLRAGLRELRAAGGPGGRPSGARPRTLALVLSAGLLAMTVPFLFDAMRGREVSEPITGEQPPGVDVGSLSFFERRVREHPTDIAARLDLAQRYMEGGRAGAALEQYLVALQLDPGNAEANAKLGYLMYRGDRPKEALRAVNRALLEDPSYPEALYYKGVILQKGMDRPEAAARAFRSYLSAAPFGSRREEVKRRLAELGAAP
jgi:cytochrome c-type biogenesis protein CcmI